MIDVSFPHLLATEWIATEGKNAEQPMRPPGREVAIHAAGSSSVSKKLKEVIRRPIDKDC